jgi:hypothetical protein
LKRTHSRKDRVVWVQQRRREKQGAALHANSQKTETAKVASWQASPVEKGEGAALHMNF